MWINPKTQQIVKSDEDVRQFYPNWSGPQVITDDMLAQLDPPLLPFAQTLPVFDPAQQLVVEGAPALVGGVWTQQWVVTGLSADVIAQNMKEMAQSLSDEIDSSVASICNKPQRFTVEYQRREAQARAYVAAMAANASGPDAVVPNLIAGFARASGLAPLDAAQLTISQADKLYAALDQLADLRMRKYEVQRASSIADARAAHLDIMKSIRSIGATLA